MPSEQSNAVNELLAQQQQLELWCRNTGRSRTLKPGWEKSGQGILINSLAHLYLETVKEIWERGRHEAGRQAHVWDLMKEWQQVEHVALEAFTFAMGQLGDEMVLNRLASMIGRRAEYVLWLTHPSWGRSLHLQGLKLASNNDLGMSLMIKRLKDAGFRKAAAFRQLKGVERVALGQVFIEAMVLSTGMFEEFMEVKPNRKQRMIRPTMAYWQFMKNWKQVIEWKRPLKLPMIIEPRPWTRWDDGGYISIRQGISKVGWERWPEVSKKMQPSALKALNMLQSVGYQIDVEMCDLLRTIWENNHAIGDIPTRDLIEEPNDEKLKAEGHPPGEYWKRMWRFKADQRRNSARGSVVNLLISDTKLAKTDVIHFVHRMDSRGRCIVDSAGINPHGPEHNRACLQFKERSPMQGHEDAFAWSLGDAYGLPKDKAKRIEFLQSESDAIARAGQDPAGYLELFDLAKDSMRFAQLCMDWSCYKANPQFKSGTIHWRDQTCSGWGHVACLTSDQHLARFTNVLGSKPADLYAGIGKIITSQLKWLRSMEQPTEKEKLCVQWWSEHEIPRSLFKSMLMPIIYGRSYRSLEAVISEYLRDELNDFLTDQGLRVLDLSRCLASIVHREAKTALPHVQDLARWLYQTACIQMDAGLRPYWFTPDGLAVESYSYQTHCDSFKLVLGSRTIRISQRVSDQKTFDRRKGRQRLCPDYIQSMDGAFLRQFTSHWSNFNHPLSTVHDCFGTTLENVETMRDMLCDQWARFYSVDYLTRHQGMVAAVTGADVPAPPIIGTLDRTRVGENMNLFC